MFIIFFNKKAALRLMPTSSHKADIYNPLIYKELKR